MLLKHWLLSLSLALLLSGCDGVPTDSGSATDTNNSSDVTESDSDDSTTDEGDDSDNDGADTDSDDTDTDSDTTTDNDDTDSDSGTSTDNDDTDSGSDTTTDNDDTDSDSDSTTDNDTDTDTDTDTTDNDDDVITTPVLPTDHSTLTFTGSVEGASENDNYIFRICAGSVCDNWEASLVDGSYAYTLEVAQWPMDQVVYIEGNKITSTESSDEETSNSIENTDSSYFKTELDTITNLVALDSDDDGFFTESELPGLALNSVTMAFNTVVEHLLADELSNYSNLPLAEKKEAVRNYLSNNSKDTVLELNDTQLSDLKAVAAPSTWPRVYDYSDYELELTSEQWEALGGDSAAEEKTITLNSSQVRSLATYKTRTLEIPLAFKTQVQLTTLQLSSIQGELVYNQQLVIELASLYQLLGASEPIEVTVTTSNAEATGGILEQIAELNSGSGEATRFEGTYTISASDDVLKSLGVYDRLNEDTIELQIDADTMREAYENWYSGTTTDFVFTIQPMQWLTGDKTLAHIGATVLSQAEVNPAKALWQHYESTFRATNPIAIVSEVEHAIDAATQKAIAYRRAVNELNRANYLHPLKSALIGLAPTRLLRVSGRFPAEFTQAQLSIVIGSRLNLDNEGVENGLYPERHLPVDLIDSDGVRRKSLDLTGQNDFVTTIALRDIDNQYSTCAPGQIAGYEYTADDMQDNLTIHIRDGVTDIQVRSLLGSFCELAQLDANDNDLLTISELDRLNVGYVSTARTALIFKQSLASYGAASFINPHSVEEIAEIYNAMPRDVVEFLAGFIALQAKGELYGTSVDLAEAGSFYDDVLALLEIDLSAEYGMVANDNSYPEIEVLQERLSTWYSVVQILLSNPDRNISHITLAMVELLSDSEVDDYYFTSNSPGSWVSTYPVNGLEQACQTEVSTSQLLGLRIEGQGEDSEGYWVTIGWDAQTDATGYTLGWDTASISSAGAASNVIASSELRATISGLSADNPYYIRVQSDVGTSSALLTYQPQTLFIADTRATSGSSGDDSTRGRDATNDCDPLSGKAQNSDVDGILGARYLKIDNNGEPLSRQDLVYSQNNLFACVLDAQTGLVWETKHNRQNSEDYDLHDNDLRFVVTPKDGATTFNGICKVPDVTGISTDPNQCTVEQQIARVNAAKRCGLDNWRLPTLQEAYGLVDFSKSHENNIDNRYFANFDFSTGFWLDTLNSDQSKSLFLKTSTLEAKYANVYAAKGVLLVSDGFKQ